MIKRFKRLWSLSRKDPEILKKFDELTEEQIQSIPELGDGKAVFFSEGTEKELVDLKREDDGLSSWYKRIFRHE